MAARGAPLGNQNAVKAKRWQQAIDRALARRSKSDAIAELDRLADVYLDAMESMATAEKPSISGFADFADRMDGKPAQTTVLAGDHENPVAVTEITRRIEKPA